MGHFFQIYVKENYIIYLCQYDIMLQNKQPNVKAAFSRS